MVRRKQRQRNIIRHDRWLLSYADFITLLFALFVVLYAISSRNESKFKALTDAFGNIFKSSGQNIEAITLQNPAEVEGLMIDLMQPAAVLSQSPLTEQDYIFQEQQRQFDAISAQIREDFSELMDDDLVKVRSNDQFIEIELNNSLLFNPAEVTPAEQAEVVLVQIAHFLSNHHHPIAIEGYTDNRPIQNSVYESNWELSGARSASIVRFLENNGVEPQRLSLVGFGEHHPVADNDSIEGQALNRRVVIVIAKNHRTRQTQWDDADQAPQANFLKSTDE